MRTALTYGAVLIALYLALAYATGGGTLLSSGETAATGVIKAFQGRG